MSQLPSTAEQAYVAALDKLTGQEKVRRGFEITLSVFNMIALQIKAQTPDIDDRELRLRVAERVYMAEPKVLALIQQARMNGGN